MATATNRERSVRASSARRRSAEIVTRVRPVAEALAEHHGLVLWDISFVREAGRETLRVACDLQGGISSAELARFSDELSRDLDRADAVPGDQRYVLEVTSPGAERKLESPEQFEVCVGRTARVSLRDGRSIDGAIAGVTGRTVEIETDDGAVRALFDDIARARLVVKI